MGLISICGKDIYIQRIRYWGKGSQASGAESLLVNLFFLSAVLVLHSIIGDQKDLNRIKESLVLQGRMDSLALL